MKVVVTGAQGFLGQHLIAHLRALGHDPYPVPSRLYDLRTYTGIETLFNHVGSNIDILFHLAADVGGIAYNLKNPASIFYNNIMMNTQLVHLAGLSRVGKFIFIGSACAYPAYPPIPTAEGDLWSGQPEESNLAYGISKRIVLPHLQACYQQFGMDFSYPILANLYGPGDCFDDDRSHVIPALIKKFVDGTDSIEVWGDGSQTRDFLYVEDAALALISCMEIEYRKPVNIAGGQSINIKNLVQIIKKHSSSKATVYFDTSKPAGQKERLYDIKRAQMVLGWKPTTTIEDGIKQTIEWYKDQAG